MLTASTHLPDDFIPTTVAQALKDPRWHQAMMDELNALFRNHTWDLIPPDPTYNLVGNKWGFTIERKADGSIDRYKARFVAKRFHKQSGIDFNDTFSLVIKPTAIQILLGLAISRGWCLKQLDVNNAFLQGHLDDDVYMTQPMGFVD